MSLPMPIDQTPAWRALAAHASATRTRHLRDLFAADENRFSAFSFRCGNMLLDLSRQRMDGETLKASRTERDRSGYGKFQRGIAGLIDQGVPAMWGVMLGLLPEPEIPQASGGHMRLIIGYNLKTNEILYTDSWGAEHALKRMPIANAYAMTTGLYYMEPMK